MTKQDDFGVMVLVGFQPKMYKPKVFQRKEEGLPIAEIVSGKFNRLSRLVSWIYLGMYNMRLFKCDAQKIMNVCRETLKTRLIAHKPMNIYK